MTPYDDIDLDQHWLIISNALLHSPLGNYTGNAKDIRRWFEFEITNLILQPRIPGANE